MVAVDIEAHGRSEHGPGHRHAFVDEPLFDPDVIPNAGDPRSVGELLRDVDFHARELLFDVSGCDAAGLLRGWPDVVDAAAQLWHALPGRPDDPDLCADLDRPMARLSALTEGLVVARGFRRWPGSGPVDHRFHQTALILTQAASLVHRYGADVAPNQQRVRRDIQAARTRLMHAVYLSAHAVTVALHERGRDLRAPGAAEGTPVPISATRSPYSLASSGGWVQRIGACERTAGAYLGHRFPEQLAGEADAASDPNRLLRALASWDIQAHRSLAAHPTPANLVLACATQARIAETVAALMKVAPPIGGFAACEILRPAVQAAAKAWANLGSRWRDLTLPQDRLDPELARAAGEIRAAYGEFTHQSTGQATPAKIATRPGIPEAVHASMEALKVSSDLAYVVNEKATDPHLTGPARALSLRAHNDSERIRDTQPRNRGIRDVLWVTPMEIHANKVVPLPRPVANGLRTAARETTQAVSSLSGALSTTVDVDNASPAGLHQQAPCPSITKQVSTRVAPPAR